MESLLNICNFCSVGCNITLKVKTPDLFFVTGAPEGIQLAFQVEPDGASFRMVNEHIFGRGVPLVGINFAPDGALYGVDWGGGYPLNQTGADTTLPAGTLVKRVVGGPGGS